MTTKTLEIHEPALRAQAVKHLIFSLGEELYGLPVLKVREITRLLEITPIPRMPGFISGVINLRGKIVPVLDLRLRFEMAPEEISRSTCIIVTQVAAPSGAMTALGLLVDGVDEVLNIAPADIEETPDFRSQSDLKFLGGIAKSKGKVILLLEVDRLLAADSLEKVSHTTAIH